MAFFNSRPRGDSSPRRPENGASRTDGDYRVVRFHDARLLAAPESDASVLGLLQAGSRVRVLGASPDGQCVRVQTESGQTGWLAAPVVAGQGGASQVAADAPSPNPLAVKPPADPPGAGASSYAPLQAPGNPLPATQYMRQPPPADMYAQPTAPAAVPYTLSAGDFPPQPPTVVADQNQFSSPPLAAATSYPQQPYAAQPTRGYLIGGLCALVAGALMAGSVWLTWVSVFGIDVSLWRAADLAQQGSVSSGWVGVGEVFFVAAAATLVGILRLTRALPVLAARITFTIVLVLTIIEAIIRIADVHSASSDSGGAVTIGVGLFVFCAGVALLLVAVVITYARDRADR